jgi:isopentenyl-diphosphate delta-isomerase
VSDPTIQHRKSEHLRIVAEEDVLHGGGPLFDGVRLLHCALPELDLADIDLSVPFFGRRLRLPLMITSMTGGAGFAGELNRGLAEVAQRLGIAFAVGSQRVLWDHPAALPDFAVRPFIPDGVLLGNIGLAQVATQPTARLVELAQLIDADGLCVHLNPAQELVQPDGDRTFRGAEAGLARLVAALDGRVLVKETGAGLSPRTLERLRQCGVSCIDVSGSGGTSWTKVEMHRVEPGPLRRLGEQLADWGVPTAASLLFARQAYGGPGAPGLTLVGSGGVNTALDAARAIACGADVCGLARPVLLAFMAGGGRAVEALLQEIADGLRSIMLLSGAGHIAALQAAERVYTGELRDWLQLLPDGNNRHQRPQ